MDKIKSLSYNTRWILSREGASYKKFKGITSALDIQVQHRPPVEDSASQVLRNKKMFNSLLGHLKKAQLELALDHYKRQKQQETEEKTKREEEKQSEILREHHLEHINVTTTQQRKEEYLASKRKIELEIAECRMKVKPRQKENHLRRTEEYCMFLRTSAQPCIFYKPARTNDNCKSKQQESSKLILEKSSGWTRTLEQEELATARAKLDEL